MPDRGKGPFGRGTGIPSGRAGVAPKGGAEKQPKNKRPAKGFGGAMGGNAKRHPGKGKGL